jgi:aminoglycoside phosphotransferase (APT) family kinase protein
MERVEMTLATKLAGYISKKLGRLAEVSNLDRISGGASRETYRFVLRAPVDGTAFERRLILRLDPAASLIETDRRTEFAAIKAFQGSDVPVPEPLWIETDSVDLGAPFMVMTEVATGEAHPFKLMQPPFAQHLETIGKNKWTVLGSIARADPHAGGFAEVVASVEPHACWRRELDQWEATLDADELEPLPIQRAAIRWLRRNPPPSAQRISIVHGDYRTGNFLVDRDGSITAVLDWEMAHLGDPLEDLAWSLNRVWHFNNDERSGGLLPRQQAISIWEKSSGLVADAKRLHWWEVFSCVKGQAIWISAAKEFQTGNSRDGILALAGWMQTNSQDRGALELLGHLRPITTGGEA